MDLPTLSSLFFFFNDTATTEIYTLSLHDALPIWIHLVDMDRAYGRTDNHELIEAVLRAARVRVQVGGGLATESDIDRRSEEHTSELQSPCNLVCRLLLEKKKKNRCEIRTI